MSCVKANGSRRQLQWEGSLVKKSNENASSVIHGIVCKQFSRNSNMGKWQKLTGILKSSCAVTHLLKRRPYDVFSHPCSNLTTYSETVSMRISSLLARYSYRNDKKKHVYQVTDRELNYAKSLKCSSPILCYHLPFPKCQTFPENIFHPIGSFKFRLLLFQYRIPRNLVKS